MVLHRTPETDDLSLLVPYFSVSCRPVSTLCTGTSTYTRKLAVQTGLRGFAVQQTYVFSLYFWRVLVQSLLQYLPRETQLRHTTHGSQFRDITMSSPTSQDLQRRTEVENDWRGKRTHWEWSFLACSCERTHGWFNAEIQEDRVDWTALVLEYSERFYHW
jgi:hypothetical protein